MANQPDVATLGQLRESGWVSRSIKDEIRQNALARMSAGEDLFPFVHGYEDTVIPQLEHAILAGHDIVFLGERGQAKTRLIRSLTNLLDEWMPIVAGSEINDDPYKPTSRMAKELVDIEGDSAPISWVHRSDRFGEKLATPDTSIADLIGEVDPIKVAEGRYLSDELTLHYGLVPRTNRGVFAINELPDLAERIQVGLLNVLEERDVQVRGYKVRLPLDVMLVASANPEDYTNRGRMITPLKDRFGAQIRTHYPLDIETEVEIALQEANIPAGPPKVFIPSFMTDLVAMFSHAARASSHINQSSGVSVRLTVSNLETLAAAAVRRSLRLGEVSLDAGVAVPRVLDLDALISSTAGKIEIEALEEGRDAEVIDHLLRTVIVNTFKQRVSSEGVRQVADAFEDDIVAATGDDVPIAEYTALLAKVPALAVPVAELLGDEVDGFDDAGKAAAQASAIELILEGMHLSKRLNKDALGSRSSYRSRS